MRRAALYVQGRIVVADSHLAAFQALTIEERNEYIVSGSFDESTGEFDSDLAKDHFYNKEMYLIRHGEVVDQEDPDPPLSENGHEQARQVAEQLKEKDLSDFQCFASPLLRCLQTAEIFAELCDVDVHIDLALMETPHFLAKNQSFYLKNRQQYFPKFNWPTTHDWLIPPESASKFATRSRNVLQRLPSKSILFSHFGIIVNIATMALCDEKAMESGVPTASVTYIENQQMKCLGQTYRAMEGPTNETNSQD